jgi:hypothetical protein
MFRIKSPQDLGAALMLVAIGAGGIWFGRELAVGTAARMGPGYMPMLVSGTLIVFGIVLGLRAVTLDGPRIEPGRWRAVVLVLAAILVFAALISTAGLAAATFVTAVLGAFASVETRWAEAVVLGICLAVLCVVLFVYALQQPIPIFWAG